MTDTTNTTFYQSSGTIDGGKEYAEVIQRFFSKYDCHLVVYEEAVKKGAHFHYVVIHESSRDTFRHQAIRALGTKVTCVDPRKKKGHSWQLAKQYLCKGDPIEVVSRGGIEFSDDALKELHRLSEEYTYTLKEKSKNKTRMEMLSDECSTLTDLHDIVCGVVRVYKREGWLCQKHIMISQVRSLYVQARLVREML
jgi:hypothetical protein